MITLAALLLLMAPNAEQQQSWAERYAPIVIHDSRETAVLTSVANLLETGPSLQGRCADGRIQRVQVTSESFLHTAAVQSLIAACPTDLALHLSQWPAMSPTSYYHVRTEARFVTLQYWFFYAWNETHHLGGGALAASCGNHEGDWEHLSLRLDRERLAQAQTPTEFRQAVTEIYLAGHLRAMHSERKYLLAEDPQLQWQGTQLMVFPALGTHATYSAASRWPLMTLAGLSLADITDGQGIQLDLSQGQVLPLTAQPWFGFPGRWGAVRHDHCNPLEALLGLSNDGPFGPGHAQQAPILKQGDWFDRKPRSK